MKYLEGTCNTCETLANELSALHEQYEVSGSFFYSDKEIYHWLIDGKPLFTADGKPIEFTQGGFFVMHDGWPEPLTVEMMNSEKENFYVPKEPPRCV